MTSKKRNAIHSFKADGLGVFERLGTPERIVKGLHAKGYDASAIARMTGIPEGDVKEIVRLAEREAERKR